MRVLLFLTLLSFSAQADEGFFRLTDFRGKPALSVLTKVAQAAPKFEELGKTCGGAFISKNGHFLTALHCVESCLKDVGIFQEQVGYFPAYRLAKTIEASPKGKICKFTKIESLNLRGADLVAVGAGFANFDEAYLPYYEPSIQKDINEIHDDYVILKFNFNSALRCTKLAATTPSLTEPIFGLGFAGSNTRDNGHGSDGDGLKIVTGVLSSDIASSEAIRRIHLLPEEPAAADGIFLNSLRSFFSQPRFLLADIDVYPGMSGGPIVNAKGELVGTVSAGVGASPADAKTHYFRNSALGLRANIIRSNVEKSLGVDATKAIFDCGSVR